MLRLPYACVGGGVILYQFCTSGAARKCTSQVDKKGCVVPLLLVARFELEDCPAQPGRNVAKTGLRCVI